MLFSAQGIFKIKCDCEIISRVNRLFYPRTKNSTPQFTTILHDDAKQTLAKWAGVWNSNLTIKDTWLTIQKEQGLFPSKPQHMTYDMSQSKATLYDYTLEKKKANKERFLAERA